MFKKIVATILILSSVFCVSGCLSTDFNTHTSSEQSTSHVTPSKIESNVTETSSEDESTEITVSNESMPNISDEPIVTSQETTESLVWIPTNGGKKYHSKSSCSGMKNPEQVTKESAINRGFGPCGRCY